MNHHYKLKKIISVSLIKRYMRSCFEKKSCFSGSPEDIQDRESA